MEKTSSCPHHKSEEKGHVHVSFYCLDWKTLSLIVFTASKPVQVCDSSLASAHRLICVIILGLPLIHGKLPVEIKNILDTNLLEFCSRDPTSAWLGALETILLLFSVRR